MSYSKRQFIKHVAAVSALTSIHPLFLTSASTTPPKNEVNVFPIGMGTWITFNVGQDKALRLQRAQVLKTFFELGGQMVDSSPMYGSAEEVLGFCFQQLNGTNNLFSATKTWTSSLPEAKQQFVDSQQRWQLPNFDLLQVHNLVAWQQNLAMLRELKQQKLIRYIGITTSHGRRHNELLKIMQNQEIDFVQLTYNIDDREVERRILPLAHERGIRVIANRPLQGGRLMDLTNNKALPSWASKIGCHNWAQFFLRFIISHPAVTCAIPATSKVEHMVENMGSVNNIPLPNAQERIKMINAFKAL
ncbi:aldo/keto reductase [Thalassotalea atypica]|uniref:aldo/keto reductase n=1 Tax=Thalassotalea atypica TaxID=2054316 RepID=UPI0025742A41|nr:aldo/keto reductase [Thalassotalea atypica]